MRFLLPPILIGAILGSHIAFAESKNTSVLRFCSSRMQERRALRLMRTHRTPSCQPKTAASSSSSRSFSSSSIRSSTSSSIPSSASTDPLADTEIRSQFLLLGEVTPILGAASIFISEEPMQVTSISINLLTEVPTVRSLLVYDDDRHFLGTANLDPSAGTNRAYKVSVQSDAFTIGQREERRLYVRARMTSKDGGGQSNQPVQIGTIVVRGNGVWSSQAYTKVSSDSSRFPEFVTSRSTILSVANAGQSRGALISGTNRELGRFTVAGRKSDSSAHIDVTDLTFDVQQSDTVTLSNVRLGLDAFNEKFPCTVNFTHIVCTSIPALYGSLDDDPRTLVITGDIFIVDTLHANLRLSLTSPGNTNSNGSLSWNDGTNVFHWVAIPGTLADGTLYEY